jgi:hypothetical protein
MWYSLRLDGMVYDQKQERRVNFLSGAPSLDQVLERLFQRMGTAVDESAGRLPNGLLCALTAQLSLGQWASWSAYQRAGLPLQTPHLPMTMPEGIARASLNSSPVPPTPATGGASQQTLPLKPDADAGS